MTKNSVRDRSALHLPFTKGQWVDADEVMFHACFAVLGTFVEEELGTSKGTYENAEADMHRGYRLHSQDHAAIDLWLWSRDEPPALEKAVAEDLCAAYSGKLKIWPVDVGGQTMLQVVECGKVREPAYPYDHDEKIKAAKLDELIKLRRTLWT